MFRSLCLSTWLRVTKQTPCPICLKADWCSISTNGTVAICMRIAEGALKETRNGGYLHRLNRSSSSNFSYRVIKKDTPSRKDLPELAHYYRQQALERSHRIQWLAEHLGLPLSCLHQLEIGWSENRRAFAFPMRNAAGTIIGIRLRSWNGRKYAVTGSKEGLFLPTYIIRNHRLLICEGPTDTAALLSLSFPVIGRPSCTGGISHIEAWVKQQALSEIVVVSDADVPGQRGAHALASRLCLFVPSVRILNPPEGIDDARAWVNAGATYNNIENTISKTPTLRLHVRGTTE